MLASVGVKAPTDELTQVSRGSRASSGADCECPLYKDGKPAADLIKPEAEGNRFWLATDQLVSDLLRRRLDGEDTDYLAWLFHAGLAELIVSACEEAKTQTGLNAVALSGGVFQNRLLLKMCVTRLRELGFTVLTHSMVPPNDGGIALGQAVVAMEVLKAGGNPDSVRMTDNGQEFC